MTALRAIDPWARIEELEAERDYYKRELGLLIDETRLALVARAFRLTSGPARILLALYEAHPRMMTKAALHQALYGAREAETEIRIVDTHLFKVRKRADIVETIRNRGYRLTDDGARQLRLVLERAG